MALRPLLRRAYSSSSSSTNPALLAWLDANSRKPAQLSSSMLDTDQSTLLSTTIHSQYREFQKGDPLPPMWHLFYHPQRYTLAQAGRDGHSSLIYPPGFDRRMWAGGSITWNTANPPRLGVEDHVASLAYSPSYKIRSGKRGPMIFLEEIRELTNSSGWCIRERRDIVYLTPTAQDQSKKEEKPKEASAEKKPAPEPKKGDFEVVVKPDEVMLFRFSALTFNSHRIHYDQPYVTKVEGYKGLVTHGPLVSTLLIDTLHKQVPALRCNVPSSLPLESSLLKTWNYRALNPWIVGEPVIIKGKFDADGNGAELWAENGKGVPGMEGRVTW